MTVSDLAWLSALPAGAVVYQPTDDAADFDIVDINDRGLRIAGLSREAVVGRRLSQVFPSADELGLVELLQRVRVTGEPVELPAARYADDRIEAWVVNRVSRLPDGRLLVLYDDVSDQVRARARSKARSELLAEAESLADLGAWEWNLETGAMTMSAGWLDIHGADEAPRSGSDLEPYAYYEDLPRIRAAFERARDHGETYDVTHRIVRRSDGEVRTLRSRGRRSENALGQPVLRGICQDITERSRVEAALRESEERYRRFHEYDPTPAYSFERRGDDFILTGYNRAASVQTGEAIEQAVGKPISLMWADRPDLRADLERCHRERSVVRREAEYRAYTTGVRGIYGFTFSSVSSQIVVLHLEELSERRAVEFRVRRRLRALTAPVAEGPMPALDEMLDVTELAELQDHLRRTVGLSTHVVDESENVVSATPDASPTDVWATLHALWPSGARPDAIIDVADGLIRLSAPIEVHGTRVGRIEGFARAADEDVDVRAWQERARSLGYRDLSGVEQTIGALPSVNEARLTSIGASVKRLAAGMAESGYRNVRQARLLAARQRAEVGARESEARYRHLFQAAPNGIVVVHGRSGEILDCNQAFLDLGDWKREDLIGFCESDLHDGTRQPCNPVVPLEDRSEIAESTLLTARGEARTVVIRAHRSRYEGQDVVMASYHDMTDHRRYESRYQRAQRLESLGLMAGGIAHHFNNLLAAMLGNADLALMDVDPDSELGDSLLSIRASAERARGLTDQILAFSGHRRMSAVDTDLSALLTQMQDFLRITAGSAGVLRYELASDLPVIVADPDQVRQIVINLVLNAVEAGEGRRNEIVIRTFAQTFSARDFDAVEVGHAGEPGRHVVLEVVDTAGGMDEAVRARAFEPFFTTHRFGRGLGLASVLGIVRAHRGSVALRSRPGQGTSVVVSFPAVSGRPAEVSLPRVSAAGKSTIRGMALVVDDEDALRTVLGRLLNRLGFRVVDFASGDAAVAALSTSSAGAGFDLALIDMTMPGLDGLATMGRLKALQPGATYIVMSGREDPGALEAGADGYLHKPFTLRDLERRIRGVIEVAGTGTTD